MWVSGIRLPYTPASRTRSHLMRARYKTNVLGCITKVKVGQEVSSQRSNIGFRHPDRTLSHPGPNERRCAERSELTVEIHIHVVIEVLTCFELSLVSCVAVMMPHSATLILACVAAAFLARVSLSLAITEVHVH